MSNSQFTAIIGAAIIFLIGTLLFERYARVRRRAEGQCWKRILVVLQRRQRQLSRLR
jgi:hypothetical protein